jgi:hypothetical protein
VPSQQLRGQLQTQHSVDTARTVWQTQHKVKDKLQTNTGGRKHINTENTVNKQTKKKKRGNKNIIIKNYITRNIRIMNKYY